MSKFDVDEYMKELKEKRRNIKDRMMYGYYTGIIDVLYDIQKIIKKKELQITEEDIENYVSEYN